MGKQKKIYLALPVLNESSSLPKLIKCVVNQEFENFELVVCVNNYDHWWNDPEKVNLCLDNTKSIEFLRTLNKIKVTIIDRCSPSHGWPRKKGGVGWARKIAMDYAVSFAEEQDVIVSIDADTHYSSDFLSNVLGTFNRNPEIGGIALPYYHKLKNDKTNRLILRYEIYMRYYLINLLRIENPYAFTALGSAMAVTVKSYRKAGGLTPVKSGEDFYFLQKLVKTGKLSIWSEAIAYPSSRFSSRVDFGTGPALLKGKKGDWASYPIYHFNSFNLVGKTFSLFRLLYEKEIETPMDAFFIKVFKDKNYWNALRKNYRDEENFIKACIRKVDGLRILQFLRDEQRGISTSDEECLIAFFKKFFLDKRSVDFLNRNRDFSFDTTSVEELQELRNLLFEKEMNLRKERETVLNHKKYQSKV